MAKNDLKQKAASGMVWTALQKYSTMGIQFISGIVLARLLTPYDYGCIGMLSIFMVLAEAFIDGGFGSALIQKKRPSQEDYSTIFWWNISMAVLMYAILFFCAPAIARFYDIPLLCDVLRVQGIVLFIYALNIVQRNQLKKKLNFKVLSIVTISTSVISLIVTIVMAYKGFGVWALVVQNLVTASIPAVVFWFFIKWRPILIFSKDSFKELFSFGFYMFLVQLLERFSTQVTGLIVGKVYNPTALGYYSKAIGTEKLASHSISSIMTQVTYPLFAEAQNDRVMLGNMIKRLSTTISYITFPMMFLLLLIAKPLFVILYSEKWLQCVPYFQLLCISGLAACLQSANVQSILAIGKSRTMLIWTIVKRVVGLTFKIGGLLIFGIYGLLIGVIINTWFSYFVNIYLVSKYIGYKWNQQLLDILPVGIVSVIALLFSFGCSYMIGLSMYWDGFVRLIVFLLVYLGWSFIFKPESYMYFLTILPSKIKFWEK